MRPTWMLVALVALTAGPAWAQGLIAPSRQYSTPSPEGLDKNYGLPTFGMPNAEVPKQKAQTPKPPPADPFKGLSTLAAPETEPSDVPDLFQKSPGVAATDNTSSVPNFFQNSSDWALPKAQQLQPGRASGETPMFTTTEGSSIGATPSYDSTSSDSTAREPAGAR